MWRVRIGPTSGGQMTSSATRRRTARTDWTNQTSVSVWSSVVQMQRMESIRQPAPPLTSNRVETTSSSWLPTTDGWLLKGPIHRTHLSSTKLGRATPHWSKVAGRMCWENQGYLVLCLPLPAPAVHQRSLLPAERPHLLLWSLHRDCCLPHELRDPDQLWDPRPWR